MKLLFLLYPEIVTFFTQINKHIKISGETIRSSIFRGTFSTTSSYLFCFQNIYKNNLTREMTPLSPKGLNENKLLSFATVRYENIFIFCLHLTTMSAIFQQIIFSEECSSELFKAQKQCFKPT